MNRLSCYLAIAVLGCACAASGSADDDDSPKPDASVETIDAALGSDSDAPLATITSPPDGAVIASDSVTVLGVATDASTITSVQVNGVAATPTQAGYAAWQAVVPLSAGPNTLTVRTEDEHGNVDPEADSITVDADAYAGPAVVGVWRGTATAAAGQHLAAGEFPAILMLAQAGGRVRGVLEIEQDLALFAERFSYVLEGALDDTGGLEVELLDRQCSAAEPDGLCNPTWPIKRAFAARASVSGTTMTWDAATVLEGVEYPDGVALDLPFSAITVTHEEPDYEATERPIQSTWDGLSSQLYSVAFARPPVNGRNDMTIDSGSGGDAMVQFNNEYIGNVVPDFPDIILAGTFAFDLATKNMWFLETATGDRWLWLGHMQGNTLSGIIAYDLLTGGVYAPDSAPADLFAPALVDVASVFFFVARDEPVPTGSP